LFTCRQPITEHLAARQQSGERADIGLVCSVSFDIKLCVKAADFVIVGGMV